MITQHFSNKVNDGTVARWFLMVGGLFLLVLVLLTKPSPMGESDDYMMPTISLLEHGSLFIMDSDIAQAKSDFPDFYEYLKNQYDSGTFYKAVDGRLHSWYMGTYSFACIPIKLLLKLARLPQSHCFGLTNVLLLLAALSFLQRHLKRPAVERLVLLMLLFFSPVLFYMTWISAEVMLFALVVTGLTFFANHEYKRAALFISIAGTLNITIMALCAVIVVAYVYAQIKSVIRMHWQDRWEIVKRMVIEFLWMGLCCAPAMLTVLYNYMQFRTLSLQSTYGFASTDGLTGRFLAYLFDWNLGMLPYMLLSLPLFLMLVTTGLFRRSHRAWQHGAAFFAVILAYSLMSHINCGMTGIARYSVWTIPIALFFLVMECGDLFSTRHWKKTANGVLVIATIATAIVVFSYGPVYPNRTSDIAMTPIARMVLDHFPQLYRPYEQTFKTRTTGETGYAPISTPVLYTTEEGELRKILLPGTAAVDLLADLSGSQLDLEKIQGKLGKIEDDGLHYVDITPDMSLTVPMDILLEKYPYMVRNLALHAGMALDLRLLSFNENCLLSEDGLMIGTQGVQYGPYMPMHAGTYQVLVEGRNLDLLRFDACLDGGEEIEVEMLDTGSERVAYQIQLQRGSGLTELRAFNTSPGDSMINRIVIQSQSAGGRDESP